MLIKCSPRQSIQLTIRNNPFCDLPVVTLVQVPQKQQLTSKDKINKSKETRRLN